MELHATLTYIIIMYQYSQVIEIENISFIKYKSACRTYCDEIFVYQQSSFYLYIICLKPMQLVATTQDFRRSRYLPTAVGTYLSLVIQSKFYFSNHRHVLYLTIESVVHSSARLHYNCYSQQNKSLVPTVVHHHFFTL